MKKEKSHIDVNNIYFIINSLAEYRRQFKGDVHSKAIASMKTHTEICEYFIEHRLWEKL